MHRLRILVAIVLALGLTAPPVTAQGLLGKIKKKAEEKIDRKTDQAIDKAMEGPGRTAPAGEKPAGQTPAGAPAPASEADQMKPGQGAWANYDFKPGDRILYADDFMQDEVGDFPRRLEFESGTMEIVEWQGSRWLRLTSQSHFAVPLGETLPERYTMEFDFAVPRGEMWIFPDGKDDQEAYLIFANGGIAGVGGTGPTARSNQAEGLLGKVARARVMADGKYVKLFINDRRLVNVPNYDPERGTKIRFWVDASEQDPAMFGNFRIAAGGRKLYDALAEKGRVATQGIYFDTGSDRIRPESSPTLKEIGAMLAEHADLKLVIEGHTDNVGSAAANQALSESRAAAVRKALIDSYGVAGERLTTRGLGASKPVGPNDTPEGRQNNRRVELVKG